VSSEQPEQQPSRVRTTAVWVWRAVRVAAVAILAVLVLTNWDWLRERFFGGARATAPIGVAPVPPTGYGRLYIWDPVVRDDAGQPTDQRRVLPSGWGICDGRDGSIDLSAGSTIYIRQVVRGAAVPDGARLPGRNG